MKTLLAILAVFLLTSCYAHIKAGGIEYTRFGWGIQKINKLDVEATEKVVTIKIESLEAGNTKDVIKPIVGVLDD